MTASFSPWQSPKRLPHTYSWRLLMKSSRKHRGSAVWLSALFLFACVALTSVALLDQLKLYMLDGSQAISLAAEVDPEELIPLPAGVVIKDLVKLQDFAAVADSPLLIPDKNTTTEAPEAQAPGRVPSRAGVAAPSTIRFGFVTEDEQVVWATETKVDIFKSVYENDQQVIVAASDNGDKLIAPGLSNTYTFYLRNTGNVNLHYTMTMEAYVTPGDVTIPINARLTRHDKKWLAGTPDQFVDMLELNGVYDSSTLAPDRYTYYTLEWEWPYEGDDTLDTLLGDRAVNEDLAVTLVIHTKGSATDLPAGGIISPDTGDTNDIGLWVAAALGSCAVLILLWIVIGKKRNEDEDEEDTRFEH